MKYCLLMFVVVFLPCSRPESVIIDEGNLQHFRNGKDIMLLNFYADWCRYSAALKPIFDKAADRIHTESPKALLGKVDCEAQKDICQSFHINKYPTLKIVRNGETMRKEYRGQRSVEALVEFIQKELKDPLHVVGSVTEVFDKIKEGTKGVIGKFVSNASEEYQTFVKVASSLKDDCVFFVALDENQQDQPSIAFREGGFEDAQYEGDKHSVEELRQWLSEKCVPLVREITFENGEELTEEGLPFVILFYHPEHTETKTTFRIKVAEELSHEKGSVNFVTADGIRFAHPLSHLGKSKKDLPIIAIDSFKHMYIFPNYEDITVPGKLKQFVDDLHSGKLHRDFHNMPPELHVHRHVEVRSVEEQPQKQQQPDSPSSPPVAQQPPAGGDVQPPDSTFKKLQPADSRYTLLNHDEL